MQLFVKVVLLFLIIFNFKVPFLYNSSVLSAVLSFFYYIFVRRSIPFTYFFRRYNAIVLITLILLCCITLSITILHEQYEYTLLKVLILQFFMLSCMVFALPILVTEDENTFEQAACIICYAFALQGLIQLTGFLVPSVGDFMIKIKPESFQEFFERQPDLRFRGYALTGSPFFELPCGFGVAFILYFRILFLKGQKYIIGYKRYLIFFLLFVGSMFSGRTAFVGLGLALLMTIFFARNTFNSWIKIGQGVLTLSLFLVIMYSSIFANSQKRNIIDEIFHFSFEFYYSYEETGRVGTASSDVLRGHYFSLPMETLIHGDGRYLEDSGGYYRGTDAGYMRMLLYGGVPFFICLLIYQYRYFAKPLSFSRRYKTEEDRKDYWCLLFLFIHLFFLEYKSDTIGTQNIMEVLLLFLGSAYMIRHYYNEEEM